MKSYNIRKVLAIMFLGICAGVRFIPMVFAETSEQSGKDEKFADTELALFETIPIIVTAAKKEQPITESPSTITVITAEDIKQSPALTIPDLLRMVPGVDVIDVSSCQPEVAIRGFNQPLSNKLLVMIDGRSVYDDLYGYVIWEALPILMKEIKQIEIIRGPGSALYGANAFNGVINIITKSPEELKGTHVSATAGNLGLLDGYVIHAGKKDKCGYKLSMRWREYDFWQDESGNGITDLTGNLQLQYEIDDESQMTFAGGFDDGKGPVFLDDETGFVDSDSFTPYMRCRYENADLAIQMFWNHIDSKASDSADQADDTLLANTYDIEAKYALNLNERNSLLSGTSFRYNTIDWSNLGGKHNQSLYAAYLENEFRATDRILIFLGGRYDYHPIVKSQVTPRGSFVFFPVEDHVLRVSAGIAFRNPTFVESYFAGTLPMGSGLEIGVVGDENLEPEKITSYEVSYQMPLSSGIKTVLNVFYNKLSDLIDVEITKYLPSPPYPEYTPAEVTFVNKGKARSAGGELEFQVLITKWLSSFVNYSYQDVVDKDTDEQIPCSPHHKGNAGLRCHLDNGLSASLQVHCVDEYKGWLGNTVDPYAVVNARVGYLINKYIEISVMGLNVLNKKHREYPAGEEIGRRLTATVCCKF